MATVTVSMEIPEEAFSALRESPAGFAAGLDCARDHARSPHVRC